MLCQGRSAAASRLSNSDGVGSMDFMSNAPKWQWANQPLGNRGEPHLPKSLLAECRPVLVGTESLLLTDSVPPVAQDHLGGYYGPSDSLEASESKFPCDCAGSEFQLIRHNYTQCLHFRFPTAVCRQKISSQSSCTLESAKGGSGTFGIRYDGARFSRKAHRHDIG